MAKAKEAHSAFSRSEKTGKAYFNVVVFQNDEPDQFGNDFSIQLGVKQDAPESEKKIYIGNMKYQNSSGRIAQSTVRQNSADDDLPF